MPLRRPVLVELAAHDIVPAPGEEPAALRARLNDRYLEAVRDLRARQRSGEVPLRDYAGRVDALRQSFRLLSLPLALWDEPEPCGGAPTT